MPLKLSCGTWLQRLANPAIDCCVHFTCSHWEDVLMDTVRMGKICARWDRIVWISTGRLPHQKCLF